MFEKRMAEMLRELTGWELLVGMLGYTSASGYVSIRSIEAAVASELDDCHEPSRLNRCRGHSHYIVRQAMDEPGLEVLVPPCSDLTTDYIDLTDDTKAVFRRSIEQRRKLSGEQIEALRTLARELD